MVKGSVIKQVNPFKSIVAPEFTVVPPVLLPRGLLVPAIPAEFNFTIPLVIVVFPE